MRISKISICLVSLICIVAIIYSLISFSIPQLTQAVYHDTNISEIANVDGVVYVTEFGEVYHLRDCSYIRPTSNLRIGTISRFKAEGYRSCSRCTPDYYYSDDSDNIINDNSEEESLPEEKSITFLEILLLLLFSIILLFNLVHLILIMKHCKLQQVSPKKFFTALILIIINSSIALWAIIDFSLKLKFISFFTFAIVIEIFSSVGMHYSYVDYKDKKNTTKTQTK